MSAGIVTGASRGLGLALARALVRDGWRLTIDARGADALDQAARELGGDVTAIAGDVSDPAHRRALVEAATSSSCPPPGRRTPRRSCATT